MNTRNRMVASSVTSVNAGTSLHRGGARVAEQGVQTLLFPSSSTSPCGDLRYPQQRLRCGAILLKTIDDELGLTARLGGLFPEGRQAGRSSTTSHPHPPTLLRPRLRLHGCQRCRPAQSGPDPQAPRRARPGDGPRPGLPAHALPLRERGGAADVYRLTQTLAEVVIAHHQARLGAQNVRRITIDLDPTDDPTHGSKALSFFMRHYDTWCYTADRGDAHLQRRTDPTPGHGHPPAGERPGDGGRPRVLRPAVRQAPRRLPTRDSGPAGWRLRHAALFAFLEAEAWKYLVAMASNARLEKRIRRLLGRARVRSKATGQSAQVSARPATRRSPGSASGA